MFICTKEKRLISWFKAIKFVCARIYFSILYKCNARRVQSMVEEGAGMGGGGGGEYKELAATLLTTRTALPPSLLKYTSNCRNLENLLTLKIRRKREKTKEPTKWEEADQTSGKTITRCFNSNEYKQFAIGPILMSATSVDSIYCIYGSWRHLVVRIFYFLCMLFSCLTRHCPLLKTQGALKYEVRKSHTISMRVLDRLKIHINWSGCPNVWDGSIAPLISSRKLGRKWASVVCSQAFDWSQRIRLKKYAINPNSIYIFFIKTKRKHWKHHRVVLKVRHLETEVISMMREGN